MIIYTSCPAGHCNTQIHTHSTFAVIECPDCPRTEVRKMNRKKPARELWGGYKTPSSLMLAILKSVIVTSAGFILGWLWLSGTWR
jgi:predicted RNA-binding Zn-ribbon protein involved in translation (DUF1610 family)